MYDEIISRFSVSGHLVGQYTALFLVIKLMQENNYINSSASINLHDSLSSQNYSPLGVSISLFVADIQRHSEMRGKLLDSDLQDNE